MATLGDIVGAIYDSVVSPEYWRPTLAALCSFADARLATVAVQDRHDAQPRFIAAHGESQVLDPLLETYAADVPFYRALPLMELDVPFTVDMIYALQGAGARQAWLDSRIAREWVIPNRLDDFFWVVLMRRESRIGTMVVMTDRDRRPITPDDIEAIARLAPHMRRAVAIADALEEQRQRSLALEAVLDALPQPILIVGEAMEVRHANAAAARLLDVGLLARLEHGRASFTFRPADAAIRRAVSIGSRDELALGGAGIGVPTAPVAIPAIAHVLPLGGRGESLRLPSRAAAAIVVAMPGCEPLPAIEAIGALFGLTPAEKRVVSQIARGHTRREIALGAGVTDGTVKSQLGAIYDKTGTRDQRELQGLVRDLTPPF